MNLITENKPGPSGMGGLGIISQLLLCKSLQPDFQQEEICSIEKDFEDISTILKEMQEYMPQVIINIFKWIPAKQSNVTSCYIDLELCYFVLQVSIS